MYIHIVHMYMSKYLGIFMIIRSTAYKCILRYPGVFEDT